MPDPKQIPENYGRLVLTRKLGEAVTVELPNGDFVRMTFLGVDRGIARLVFEAPREINIARNELLGTIRRP